MTVAAGSTSAAFAPPVSVATTSTALRPSPWRSLPLPSGRPFRHPRRPSTTMQSTSAAVAAATAAAIAASAAQPDPRAPELSTKSFVATSRATSRAATPTDPATGLPLTYDPALIEAHWRENRPALRARWRDFLAVAGPPLARVATALLRGGARALSRDAGPLARDARVALERLGPTFVKAGQMMSARPDMLPPSAMRELARLQDAVPPFDTRAARRIVEAELAAPLGVLFEHFADEPVAAASLAQVYQATLPGGRRVAVKVQRPGILETVSKDLYVLRRAAEVYQRLMARFAPQQRTDYVAILNEWAIGFYTELDFANEAANQRKLRDLLEQHSVDGVYVPRVYDELCTRRVLVTEWVDGRKLSDCSPDEIRELTAIGQECFLTQLLQVGLFHADPHPGNMLRLDDPSKGKLALLDFGLVASLQQEDMDQIVSALINLANRDFAALTDDFVALGILPTDCDRRLVLPLMDKALSPYVKGGGARKYEAELRRTYGMDGGGTIGGLQAMTRDALTVFNDIPFSIPPYFALVARAVLTLEGLALQGDPDYSLVRQAYPFVARKLLSDDRPPLRNALHHALRGGAGAPTRGISLTRLAALLSAAGGAAARDDPGQAFIDLDSLPDAGAPLGHALRALAAPSARALRAQLRPEAAHAADVLLRRIVRKAAAAGPLSLPPVPVPVLLRRARGGARLALVRPARLLDAAAPPLSREDGAYALALADAARGALGDDVAALVAGDAVARPDVVARVLVDALASRRGPAAGPLFGLATGGARTEDGGGKWAEIVEAADGLGDEERAVLVGEARAVAELVWERWLGRLSSTGDSW